MSVTPLALAAATISRPCSTVEATGFSTSTEQPALMTSSATEWWRWVGAATITASRPSSSRP